LADTKVLRVGLEERVFLGFRGTFVPTRHGGGLLGGSGFGFRRLVMETGD
jgi:hypothetical protein